jgi:hypothetical protein
MINLTLDRIAYKPLRCPRLAPLITAVGACCADEYRPELEGPQSGPLPRYLPTVDVLRISWASKPRCCLPPKISF